MKWSARLALALGAVVIGTAVQAEPGDVYQFVLIPGAPNVGQDVVRTNTVTGASMLCPGSACIPITDATPVPAGSYRLVQYSTFLPDLSNRTWNVMRLDAKSGRIWSLNYDGKTTSSWSEFTYGK